MDSSRRRRAHPSPAPESGSIQDLLDRFSAGDEAASAELLERLYQELRGMAAHYMRGEREDHTLQPTALVNEAYLRLMGGSGMVWKDKAHFLGTAARTMRRILVDHARRRLAGKRGSGAGRVTLEDDRVAGILPGGQDLIVVHEALERLAALSERQARIVDMRFFTGLSVEETARILGVSPRTVKSETRMAKAWLRRELA